MKFQYNMKVFKLVLQKFISYWLCLFFLFFSILLNFDIDKSFALQIENGLFEIEKHYVLYFSQREMINI